MDKKMHADRSPCPIAHAIDIVGDRWSVLVLRQIMVLQQHEFKDFLNMPEDIATNILTDRLKKLQAQGMIEVIPHPQNKKKKLYFLRSRGIAFIPVLMKMMKWSVECIDTIPEKDQFCTFVDDNDQLIDEFIKYAQEWTVEKYLEREKLG